jgi:hypothetical protein
MDRGAILMYSNGANQKFGTKVKIEKGVVTATVSQIDANHPDNNKMGADDYVLAVVYTYTNGYGETAAITEGFSNNQQFLTGNGGNVSNDIAFGENGGTLQLPSENPDGDLDDYTWSEIQTLAKAKLSKDDYKNKYGIEPGDTIVSNGTTYVLVDLGIDNNSDGVIDDEEQKGYDGFVFMYNAGTTNGMNSTQTNAGGYAASAMKRYIDDGDDTNNVDLYDKLDPNLKPFLKKVTITYNDGNPNYTATHEYAAHIFLASAKEVGLNVSEWPYSDGYMAEGTCFDLFTTDNSSRKEFMSTTSISYYWWLRSARSNSTHSFCIVVTTGYYSSNTADYSYEVVPAFVIG